MDAFVGEIRPTAGTWVWANWSACSGQQVSIQQFQMLYAVINGIFGPYTSNTFSLPKLLGRTPMGTGTGTALTERWLGEDIGLTTAGLSHTMMPPHTHDIVGSHEKGGTDTVGNTVYPARGNDPNALPFLASVNQYTTGATNVTEHVALHPDVMSNTGGSQAHENRQPRLALLFMICMNGEWPPRP